MAHGIEVQDTVTSGALGTSGPLGRSGQAGYVATCGILGWPVVFYLGILWYPIYGKIISSFWGIVFYIRNIILLGLTTKKTLLMWHTWHTGLGPLLTFGLTVSLSEHVAGGLPNDLRGALEAA